MANELIISVSGLRGVVGDTLTADVAYRYAAAFAATLPAGNVLISRDGRANGPQLLPPVVAGLSQNGSRRVLDAGVAATPTVGVLVRHYRCAGGIQISASHNPSQYNGLKLFASEGRVIPAAAGERVLEYYGRTDSRHPNFDETITSSSRLDDTTSVHLALIEQIVDVERIRQRRFRVLLDANHGSGSVLGAPLLKHLGCEVEILGSIPDGLFTHLPEPTAENLAGVQTQVTRTGATVGFCQDPDADRLAIIDEHGRYIGEEYTLAICVNHVLRKTPGPVVTNCSTSRMTEDIATKFGVPFFRSAVGEANVVDLMLRESAVIGGEGNGGAIDPRVVYVRESFAGMALVLDAMAERNLTISALAGELPRYEIYKTKVAAARDKIPAMFEALERKYSEASPDRLDGLRLDWPGIHGKWLLVRASNTEPIIRIIAEARTAGESRQLCDEAIQAMQSK